MIRVSPSEQALLTVARAVLGQGQYAPVEDVLRARHELPQRLSPGAMHVLKNLLAKGGVLTLVRGGGWRRRRHLHAGQEASGRLWERHPTPPALRFSPLSMQVLRWLTVEPIGAKNCRDLAVDSPPTLADELVLHLVCRLLAGTTDEDAVAAQELFRRSALCRLAFPEVFVKASTEGLRAATFAPLLEGGAPLLEALQSELALRWRRVEESRPRLFDPAKVIALGASQDVVLTAFLDAVDTAGRRDLAGFLLEAARPLLEQPASRWLAGMSPSASLSQRAEAARATAVFFRALGRLARWDTEHRAVRFFDDGYDAAQLLLSEWNAFGESGFRRAADRERDLSQSLGSAATLRTDAPSPSSLEATP